MSDHVAIQLSRDEALVLFDWLARTASSMEKRIEDQAEQRALWNLASLLESALIEPFAPNYSEVLAAARAKLRDPT